MAIFFNNNLLQKAKSDGVDVYAYQQNNMVDFIVSYIINHKTRKSVRLSNWLDQQVQELFISMNSQNWKIPFDFGENNDAIMLGILKRTMRIIKYTPDKFKWGTKEYWQTFYETDLLKSGDCEDGAIYMYCLARMCGIPETRLKIWAGEIVDNFGNSGGHCCLLYKPNNYPLDWFAMDWCFYPESVSFSKRKHLILSDVWCETYEQTNQEQSIPCAPNFYYRTWFIFDEQKAYNKIKIKYR